MSAIKVGDALLTGSETADRQGDTDEQLVKAHSRVWLGISASIWTRSRGASILGNLSLVLAAMHGEQHHVIAVNDV